MIHIYDSGEHNLGTLSNDGDRDEVVELLDEDLPLAVRPAVRGDPQHRPRSVFPLQRGRLSQLGRCGLVKSSDVKIWDYLFDILGFCCL